MVGKNARAKPARRFVRVKGSAAKPTQADLPVLKDIIEAGHPRSIIDRTQPLESLPRAHAYVQGFRKRGKVAVEVASG